MALGPASGIDLSICTITTQEWKDLEPCLRSLAENLLKERSVEVVIVNNCSTDTDYGVLEELRRVFPIHVIENTERLNFGANNNLALRAARGRYVLVLNPDTLILSGALDRMLDFMESTPGCGASSCKLLYADRSFQACARRFPKFRYAVASRLHALQKRGRWIDRFVQEYVQSKPGDVDPKPVDSILGACMFIRRETLDTVGLFDERFVLHAEDTDLCFRIWKGGWEIWYVPDAAIVHFYARAAARSLINRKTLLQVYTLLLFHAKHTWRVVR